MITESQKNKIIEICNKYHPEEKVIALVGSMVRGDYTEKSDIDIVIYSYHDVYHRHVGKFIIEGIQCNIMQKPVSFCNVVRGFELSYQNIETGEVFNGKDDSTFLEERHRYKEKYLMVKTMRNI